MNKFSINNVFECVAQDSYYHTLVFINVYSTHDSMIIWSDNVQEASNTMARPKIVYLRGLCCLIEDQTFSLN